MSGPGESWLVADVWPPSATNQNNSLFLAQSSGIIYANNLFFATKGNTPAADGLIEVSTDGITWVSRQLPTSKNYGSIAYGNNIYVALTLTTGVAVSTDGIVWTLATFPTGYKKVIFANGVFIAISAYTGFTAVSTDGLAWSFTPITSFNSSLDIAFGAGKFVIIQSSVDIFSASSNISHVFVSTNNGASWTLTNFGYMGVFITYGAGKFVTSSGYTSSTGNTWTYAAIPPAATKQISTNYATPALYETENMQFFGDRFYAITGDKVALSFDGTNWAVYSIPISVGYYSVALALGPDKIVGRVEGASFVIYSLVPAALKLITAFWENTIGSLQS